MAETILCETDTRFQHQDQLIAFPHQHSESHDLVDENACDEKFSQFGGLQSPENNLGLSRNPAYRLSYDYTSSEFAPFTCEPDTISQESEESIVLDHSWDLWDSWDAINSDSSYTFGPPQPEEKEPETSSNPRLSCRKCYRRFENAYSLEQHAKITGHRIFICPVVGCDMSYTRRDSWTRHKRSHNLELTCDLCPKSDQKKTFKRKDHLLTHQRNCHPQSCKWQEAPRAPNPLPALQAPSKCSCSCSKSSSILSTGSEARAGLEDIVEIKSKHQDRSQVLRALGEKFELENRSPDDFASILADLVPPQLIKPEF